MGKFFYYNNSSNSITDRKVEKYNKYINKKQQEFLKQNKQPLSGPQNIVEEELNQFQNDKWLTYKLEILELLKNKKDVYYLKTVSQQAWHQYVQFFKIDTYQIDQKFKNEQSVNTEEHEDNQQKLLKIYKNREKDQFEQFIAYLKQDITNKDHVIYDIIQWFCDLYEQKYVIFQNAKSQDQFEYIYSSIHQDIFNLVQFIYVKFIYLQRIIIRYYSFLLKNYKITKENKKQNKIKSVVMELVYQQLKIQKTQQYFLNLKFKQDCKNLKNTMYQLKKVKPYQIDISDNFTQELELKPYQSVFIIQKEIDQILLINLKKYAKQKMKLVNVFKTIIKSIEQVKNLLYKLVLFIILDDFMNIFVFCIIKSKEYKILQNLLQIDQFYGDEIMKLQNKELYYITFKNAFEYLQNITQNDIDTILEK